MIIDYENFVLARPGWNEKYKREVTWEELKKTFLLYKRIPMIVAGGSHFGGIDPNEAIGFIDAKIHDDEQIIRGEPVFFDERFEEVPAEVQQMLAHKKFVPASLGYEPYENMRKLDHVLIGAKSPVFKDVGFNAETTFQYEETEGINNEDPKEPSETKTVEFVSMEVFEQFKKELFEEMKKETPIETPEEEVMVEKQEEPEEEIQEPPAEVPTVSQPKPKVEPERVIKREQSSQEVSSDGLFTINDGSKVISHPIGKPQEKEK